MLETCYERGIQVRREVLGDAHVDRAESTRTSFDALFQRFITETAWGTLWASDDLDRPTRSLITIAILAALGCDEELALHLRATANTGATPEQICEALMHVTVYAGVPAANSAWRHERSALPHLDIGGEPRLGGRLRFSGRLWRCARPGSVGDVVSAMFPKQLCPPYGGVRAM